MKYSNLDIANARLLVSLLKQPSKDLIVITNTKMS